MRFQCTIGYCCNGKIKLYWNIAICWMAPGWKSNLRFTSTFSFLTLPLIRTSWPYTASPDCCIWSHKDSWSKWGCSNRATVWHVFHPPPSEPLSQGWHWEWLEGFLFQQYLLEEYRLDQSFSSFPTSMYSRKHWEWTCQSTQHRALQNILLLQLSYI